MSSKSPLTPKKIVAELDKYIVGQDAAKRAVAVALRNRWRRQQLPPEIQEEIHPKNILLIGPTGVGKTEIARRISRLTSSPFIKVEASKFTEVGYVGRDVESMIRDLVDLAVNMVRREYQAQILEKARRNAEERVLDHLVPAPPRPRLSTDEHEIEEYRAIQERRERLRERFRERLRQGELDEQRIEVEVSEKFGGMIEVFSSSGMEEIGMQIKDMMPGLFQKQTKRRWMTVAEALEVFTEEEAEKLVDMDKVIREAIERVEQSGIVFIDEIDKVAGRESGHGPDVSREGVQRDLLPLVEGTMVTTKYGVVHTDHILFFAAGAFNVTRPADLIPELQGRFPIRVDVEPLRSEDLERILTEPQNSLTMQYKALLEAEDVHIEFDPSAVRRIAELAAQVNEESENIGARRLHTLMERVLEDLSFRADEFRGQTIVIDADYVNERIDLERLLKAEDVRRRRKPGFQVK
jgi:ATP-dependent HslUV protease ATP-binding subunit HslU